MNTQIVNLFFNESKRIFDFLTKDYSFSMPILEIDEEINFAYVTFKAKNIAIECIFDERDKDVSCKASLLDKGKKTKHYAADNEGNIVRGSISAILRQRGVRAKLFTKIGKKATLEEIIESVLMDYALMLKNHGKDILNDSKNIFKCS